MQLRALDIADPAAALRALLEQPPNWTDAATFLRARNVPYARHADLVAAAGAIEAGGLIVAADAFARLRAAILATLGDHHQTAPELPGLQAERLRLSLMERPPVPGFRGLLQGLLADGLVAQDGPWYRLPSHRISLTPTDEKFWHAAQPMIEGERFRPPRTRDIAKTLNVPEPAARTTLKRLMRMGQVVEIAQDHFFLRETVAEMAQIAAECVDTEGLLTAASFRDRLDNGRKVAIQILEFFDKTGITIRQGDARRIRRDRLDLFGAPQA